MKITNSPNIKTIYYWYQFVYFAISLWNFKRNSLMSQKGKNFLHNAIMSMFHGLVEAFLFVHLSVHLKTRFLLGFSTVSDEILLEFIYMFHSWEIFENKMQSNISHVEFSLFIFPWDAAFDIESFRNWM